MFVNELFFAGFLGKDAESFKTQSGTEIVTLNICHQLKTRESQDKEITTWLRCKVFHPWSQSAKNYKKGDNVFIKGTLRENKWIDKKSSLEKTSLELMANVVGVFQRETKPQPGSGINPSSGAQFDEFGTPSSDDMPF